MKILNFIKQFWEFISRLARVIAMIDDSIIEAKAFWDWLTGKEPKDPEVPEKTNE